MGATTAKVHYRSASAPGGASPVTGPVRPASSRPVASRPGAFQDDPVIAERARRGAYPLDPPSWKAFRGYVGSDANLAELRAVGLPAMVRAHHALAVALAAAGACLLLTLIVLVGYFALLPATADADSPYTVADVAAPESTPENRWKAGEIPSLYQADPAWAALPYGQTTLASAGAAPTALAMAYVAVTGDDGKTPADFAQWATDHDLTASGADTIAAYLGDAAGAFGLALDEIGLDDRSLRRAIVSNVPVLLVTAPGTFSPVASVVVLDDIDRDSRIVLHDPTSTARTAKSWSFDDITRAAEAAFTVTAA